MMENQQHTTGSLNLWPPPILAMRCQGFTSWLVLVTAVVALTKLPDWLAAFNRLLLASCVVAFVLWIVVLATLTSGRREAWIHVLEAVFGLVNLANWISAILFPMWPLEVNPAVVEKLPFTAFWLSWVLIALLALLVWANTRKLWPEGEEEASV